MEPAVTGRRDVQYRATVGVDAAEPEWPTAGLREQTQSLTRVVIMGTYKLLQVHHPVGVCKWQPSLGMLSTH